MFRPHERVGEARDWDALARSIRTWARELGFQEIGECRRLLAQQ